MPAPTKPTLHAALNAIRPLVPLLELLQDHSGRFAKEPADERGGGKQVLNAAAVHFLDAVMIPQLAAAAKKVAELDPPSDELEEATLRAAHTIVVLHVVSHQLGQWDEPEWSVSQDRVLHACYDLVEWSYRELLGLVELHGE